MTWKREGCPQQLSSDGCCIKLSRGGEVKLRKYVYSLVTSPGVIEQVWDNTTGTSAPHDNPGVVFGGPPSGDCFLPSHINGDPGIDQITADWVSDTLQAGSPGDGSDQFRWQGWIFISQDGTILRDINLNSGERRRIWIDGIVVHVNNTDSATGSSAALGEFATLNTGWHYLVFEGSDFSFYGGLHIQESTDGGVSFSDFSGATSTTVPRVACRMEDCDYELQAGEFACAPAVPYGCPTHTLGEGDSSCTAILVDQSFLVHSVVSSQDVNDNGPILFAASSRVDTGWAHAANSNSFTYTGSPDHVEIEVMVSQIDPGGTSRARANPVVELYRGTTKIADSRTGYLRDATGHTESSNTVSFTDPTPGVNPVYTVLSRQESAEGDSLTSNSGHFSGKAVNRVPAAECNSGVLSLTSFVSSPEPARQNLGQPQIDALTNALMAVLRIEPEALPKGADQGDWEASIKEGLDALGNLLSGGVTTTGKDREEEEEEEEADTAEPLDLLRWSKVGRGEPLNWYFDANMTCWNGHSPDDLKSEVRDVLAEIAGVCGATFSEVNSKESADLKFMFDVVDGPNNVLAFAVVPSQGTEMSACGSPCGSITQDIDEDLNIHDYYSVTLHEVGHTMGVPHLSTGVMQARYQRSEERLKIDAAFETELLKRYPKRGESGR